MPPTVVTSPYLNEAASIEPFIVTLLNSDLSGAIFQELDDKVSCKPSKIILFPILIVLVVPSIAIVPASIFPLLSIFNAPAPASINFPSFVAGL